MSDGVSLRITATNLEIVESFQRRHWLFWKKQVNVVVASKVHQTYPEDRLALNINGGCCYTAEVNGIAVLEVSR